MKVNNQGVLKKMKLMTGRWICLVTFQLLPEGTGMFKTPLPNKVHGQNHFMSFMNVPMQNPGSSTAREQILSTKTADH